MTTIATHVRVFNMQPDDDLVVKRTAAINELAEFYGKARPVKDILQTANDLAKAVEAKGSFSKKLSDEIASAISNSSESFVADGRELEMIVCGMLGALQSLAGDGSASGRLTTTDVFAVGLWSALSFQKERSNPKLEALRKELMTTAHAYVMKTAASSRTRLPVPDLRFNAPKEFDAAGVEKSVVNGAKATIEALRANAAVDREEIDLLWWVLSDRSTLLGRRLSTEKNHASAAVASGIEAGRMLRRLPAEAHLHLVLRNVRDGVALTLSELVKTVEVDRKSLCEPFAHNADAVACPAVFPLMSALLAGTAADASSKVKRPIEDWAARALLESSILHVTAHLPSVAV